MAKLTSFSIDGMDLWFWSHDHDPPHFHAKRKGEWETKVKFLENADGMFEVVQTIKKKGISKADLKLLPEMVEEHRPELLKEWEEKVHQS